MQDQPHNYLRRLPSEDYRGRAFVHWTMTIDGRKAGWLVPVLYYKLREILTHTAFRYGLYCPLYCCMPDHLHFLWAGILESCNQRNAARFLRKQLNIPLARLGVQLQKQPHDHVLRNDERQESAFEGDQTPSESIIAKTVRWDQARPLWIACNVFGNCDRFRRRIERRNKYEVAKFVRIPSEAKGSGILTNSATGLSHA